MMVMGPAPTTAIGSRNGSIVASGMTRLRWLVSVPGRLARHFLLSIRRDIHFEVRR